MLSPRVLNVLGGLLWLLASSLGPENSSALAQNADDKPPDQQSIERNLAKEAQTAAEFAEAQRLLNGPAGNPECVWLGRRVVSLLWRDDMDTAFRHLDLYDRFGCPGGHIQAAFRCLVLNGNIDPKNPESLNGRVQACWVNPSLLAAPASASGRAKRRNALGRPVHLRPRGSSLEEAPMTSLLPPAQILPALILLGVNTPALAVDRTFQIEVENSLKETVPSNWWLRASWRDQTLVVFVSPSAQESFDLWYDTAWQKETLEKLCKAIPAAIWTEIKSEQDIAVEQVVGGNGGKGSFQVSCRKYLSEKSTD